MIFFCLHARRGAGSWKPLYLTAFLLVGFLTSSRTLQIALQLSTLQVRTEIKSPVEWSTQR